MKHLVSFFILVFLASCGSDDSDSGTQTTPKGPPPPFALEEPNRSPGNDSTPTLRIRGVKTGSVVTLYKDPSCDTQTSLPVTVESGDFALITSYDLSGDTDAFGYGEVTFYAAIRESADGGPVCLKSSVSYAFDILAPEPPASLALEDPAISPGTDPTPTINVSGVEGEAVVTLYKDSSCEMPISDSARVFSGESAVSITAKSLGGGGGDVTMTFFANQRDKGGNESPCSRVGVTYVFDVTAPEAPTALVMETPSTSRGLSATPTIKVSGVEERAMVILYRDSVCETPVSESVQVDWGEDEVSITSYDISRDDNQDVEVSFYAVQIDRVGNRSPCSTATVSYIADLVGPSRPTALNMNTPSSNSGENPTPIILVEGVEEGARVTLYSDNTCSSAISSAQTVQEGETSILITSNDLGTSDISLAYYSAQVDTFNRSSGCSSANVPYNFDFVVPKPSRLVLQDPSTSPGVDPTPTIRIEGLTPGFQVRLYSDSACTNSMTVWYAVPSGRNSVALISNNLGSSDRTVTYYAIQRKDGESSGCSTASVTYEFDHPVPPPSGLSLDTPSSSPGNNPTPTILVEGLILVEIGGTNSARVRLYSDSSCSNAISSTYLVPLGETSVRVRSNNLGSSDRTVTYYAQQTFSGVTSACSSASVTYQFVIPPLAASVETGSYFHDDSSSNALRVSVTFGENVNVTGTPRIELTIGAATKYATYASGSGTSTLTFSYDVSSDDYDNDGIEMAATIDLNGGEIKNGSNQDAPLTFTAPDNLGRVWINFREKIFSTDTAFAFLKKGGSVVTWGNTNNGGNSSGVSGDLASGVSEIFSTNSAFAALKSNGSVVTWGNTNNGGNSSGVSGDLASGVREIFSTWGAFAALKDNGSVVTWGFSAWGGNSSGVSGDLASGVSEIFSTVSIFGGAFAALKSNDSVVTWGHARYGGDSGSVSGDLASGVSEIFSTDYAFAALKSNDSVVTWGHARYGGNSGSVSGDLASGVSEIFSTGSAFAALKDNGSVVTWGFNSHGGNSDSVSGDLASGVNEIFSTDSAFAALKSNGSVVTWGLSTQGGNSSSVSGDLASGVSEIFSTSGAFAALKDNGSVVTWGLNSHGGNSDSVSGGLASGVSEIFSTNSFYGAAFAALKSNGSVVTWGYDSDGGDSSSVSGDLANGVSEIFSTLYAFAALKEDGSVVTWGDSNYGGDSASVDLSPRW